MAYINIISRNIFARFAPLYRIALPAHKKATPEEPLCVPLRLQCFSLFANKPFRRESAVCRGLRPAYRHFQGRKSACRRNRILPAHWVYPPECRQWRQFGCRAAGLFAAGTCLHITVCKTHKQGTNDGGCDNKGFPSFNQFHALSPAYCIYWPAVRGERVLPAAGITG